MATELDDIVINLPPNHEINLVTIGKAGVGKSTLANIALGKDLCPVSSSTYAGNTSLVEKFHANVPVLIDTK